MRRRLATLFVDIAGSTSLLIHHPPEVVLGIVQGFMTLVTEVASAHAGTVKDFEGDGALLYFASMKNAVRAALAIRGRLADDRCDIACGDGPGIAARMSVTVGDVVVGAVGSSMRRGIALIGPSVNIGARLLKHAPPGAIITSGEVFEELRRDAPLPLSDSAVRRHSDIRPRWQELKKVVTVFDRPRPGEPRPDDEVRGDADGETLSRRVTEDQRWQRLHPLRSRRSDHLLVSLGLTPSAMSE